MFNQHAYMYWLHSVGNSKEVQSLYNTHAVIVLTFKPIVL